MSYLPYQVPAGQWFAIPVSQFQKEVEAYRHAVGLGNQLAIRRFESGATGWRRIEGPLDATELTVARAARSGRRLVVVSSPNSSDVRHYAEYARRCIRDSLMRGEAPIAGHVLYEQAGVLGPQAAITREQSVEAGLAWLDVAECLVCYVDMGVTRDMERALEIARDKGLALEYRRIGSPAYWPND